MEVKYIQNMFTMLMGGKMERCFLIGHHDAPLELYPYILEAVERHITQYDVGHFLVGCTGDFDLMAIRALREAKKKYPYIKAMLLTPYSYAECPLETPLGFDGIYYPERMEIVADLLRVTEANRKAVVRSDHVIAYMHRKTGRTAGAVGFALSYEKIITFLPDI